MVLRRGTRTPPATGIVGTAAAALVVVVGRPSLWVLGALAFVARGGILAMALPIVTIPSPVVLSVVFREQLTASGLVVSPASATALMIATALLLAGALLLAAYADVAMFERFVGDPESEELRRGRVGRTPTGSARRALVLAIAATQAMLLLPAGIAAAITASRVEAAVIAELRSPSDLAVPLFVRVLDAVREPVVVVIALLVLADLAAALTSRSLLTAAFAVDPDARPPRSEVRAVARGLGRIVARPLRTLATFLLAWMVRLAVLVPILWALAIGWDGVRGSFLTAAGLAEPEALAVALASVGVFAAIWVAGIVLAGWASAVRAGLWSADALR
jgi:hypothetical protein